MSARRKSARSKLCKEMEALEIRRLLCADAHSAIGLLSAGERDLPDNVAAMFAGGHITTAQYASLSPEVQAKINPHEISDAHDIPPIDYDAILGIPEHLDGRPAGEVEENLPDFFPGLTGSVSVDQTSQPGRTLLRFGTRVHNQGTGPASLISGRPGVDPIPSGAPITAWVNPDGSQNVLQGVYRWTGSSFVLSYYRAAGRFTYHAGHGHFHFDGYAYYKLRHRNSDGTPGAYVMREGQEVVGTKTGFCLINTTSSFIMENGQSSTTLPGYSSSSPYNGQPTMSCGLMQGVRVGMADDYSSSLEGQWIDVTGVPNGQYFIEISLDGENAVLESNENNNAKSFAHTLNVNQPGGGITPDVFDTGGANNNTLANAVDMGVMGTFNQTGLTIHYGQDFDWFRFRASSTGTYTITTAGVSGNLDLYLFDAQGTQLRASTGTTSSESVSYPFVKGETYYVRTEAYNSTLVSNYQITWNLKPEVTNTVGVAQGSELGQVPATFVIERNGPTSSPLSVTFSLGGTAVRDVDYIVVADAMINPTTISIGDLQSEAIISIVPLPDGDIEAVETVILTITSNNAYVVGGDASATVTIADTPPQVTGAGFDVNSPNHEFNFSFSLDVSASLGLDDVSVIHLGTGQPVSVTSFAYGDRSDVARFAFSGPLPDGNYRATLSAAGVTHALGAPLASDGTLDFFVFAGDFNRDRSIDIADFSIMAGSFGLPRSYTGGDANYDGLVDIADFAILASKFNTTLGQPARAGIPALPAAPKGSAALFGAKAVGSLAERVELVEPI